MIHTAFLAGRGADRWTIRCPAALRASVRSSPRVGARRLPGRRHEPRARGCVGPSRSIWNDPRPALSGPRRTVVERAHDGRERQRPTDPSAWRAGAAHPEAADRRLGERGLVKQSFSHGRSKTVVVETKRRRARRARRARRRRSPSAVGGFRGARPSRPRPSAGHAAGRRPSRTGAEWPRPSEDERRARQRVIEAARRAQARSEAVADSVARRRNRRSRPPNRTPADAAALSQ